MYGKLINNKLELAPKYIVQSGKIIFNPSRAKLLKLGYKEIIDEKPDETLESNEYWQITYSETSSYIYKNYTKAEIPEDPTIEEAVANYIEEHKDEIGGAGQQGADGKSAYQIALDAGFSGTQQEWLDSLKGEDGQSGVTGAHVVTQNVSSYKLRPNTFYVFTQNLSVLEIQFDTDNIDSDIVNDFHFIINNGNTAMELILPNTVTLPDDFRMIPNTVCEISIIDGLLDYKMWSL